MKKTKKVILVIALILSFTAIVNSEVITIFDSNATISAGDTYDTVVVRGDGTVVDMDGGSVAKLFAMNNCTVNISGGSISQFSSHDSSTVNIFGDAHIGPGSRISGRSKANFYGNSEAGSVSCYSYAEISISEDADIAGSVYIYENCRVFISGGSGYGIMFQSSNSEVFISGGSFATMGFYNVDPGQNKVYIIGYDLEAEPYGGTYSEGVVSGYWNNDSPFIINLLQSQLYDIISLYDGVLPSNCANPPQSDLNDDCVVNFIDLSKMASEWLYDGTE